MIKSTWKSYYSELKKLWYIKFTADAIKEWCKPDIRGFTELILYLCTPVIFLIVWLTFPISYPIITYLRLRSIEAERQLWEYQQQDQREFK